MASADEDVIDRLRWRFLASVGIFLGGALVGGTLFPRPESDVIASPASVSRASYSTLDFALRNGSVALLLVFGGCFLGIVTLGTLLHNGYVIGGIVGAAVSTGTSPWLLLAYMGPHGIFELAGFFLAAAVGFDVALYVVDRLRNYERFVLDGAPTNAWARAVLLALGLIVVAAAIEAHVTPAVVRYLLAP